MPPPLPGPYELVSAWGGSGLGGLVLEAIPLVPLSGHHLERVAVLGLVRVRVRVRVRARVGVQQARLDSG
jgi:hypothetical protein